MSEFKKRLICLCNVYKIALPPTIRIVLCLDDSGNHLEIHHGKHPTVIHDCWEYITILRADRKELPLGEQL